MEKKAAKQLEMYTLYFNPSDYPGKFVIRRFIIEVGNPQPVADPKLLVVAETRELAEEVIPKWMVFLSRNEEDDKVILGTYI